MSPLNRGGLLIITQPAQQIFLTAECHFRQFTSETDLQRLDTSGITHDVISDSDICNLMISDAEIEPDSHVCKDILHSIVSVYIRILFSDIRARALNKGISRSCKGAIL